MRSIDFCFWLQGALEVNPPDNGLSKEALEIVKNHLNSVFIHEIDPSIEKESNATKHQLDAVHQGRDPYARC